VTGITPGRHDREAAAGLAYLRKGVVHECACDASSLSGRIYSDHVDLAELLAVDDDCGEAKNGLPVNRDRDSRIGVTARAAHIFFLGRGPVRVDQ